MLINSHYCRYSSKFISKEYNLKTHEISSNKTCSWGRVEEKEGRTGAKEKMLLLKISEELHVKWKGGKNIK